MKSYLKNIINICLSLSLAFSSLSALAQDSSLEDSFITESTNSFSFIGYSIFVPEEGDKAYISTCYLNNELKKINCNVKQSVTKIELEKYKKRMKKNRRLRRLFNFGTASAVTVAGGVVVGFIITFVAVNVATLPLLAWAGITVTTSTVSAGALLAWAGITLGTAGFTYSFDVFDANEISSVEKAIDSGSMISGEKQIAIFEDFLEDFAEDIVVDNELETVLQPLM